jgi:DNA-binding LytR/AlgR family response regulator
MSKKIPLYYINRKNTVKQILFTSIFAYAFINLYKPFGSDEWYDVSWRIFSLASGLLVVLGMFVVIISRLLMFWVKRFRAISILYYILMVAGEIIFMAIFYAMLEKIVMQDMRPFALRVYISIQNTALILLIPYLISILFFEWQEKKMTLEKLIKQLSHKAYFIPFNDFKGTLMLTLKTNDLIYLESSDNYVVIHYVSDGKTKTYLIRNSLKQLEKDLTEFPLLRCHRSFMVNIKHVKMMKRERGKIRLLMDNADNQTIPVSRTYAANVIKTLISNMIIQEYNST